MTSGKGEDDKGYEWQSWPSDSLEGMPPKRRRLVVCVLLWLIILGSVLQAALDAVEIPQLWRSLTYTAVVVAIFAPLIRGAVTETRALRAEGVDVPSYTVTPKSLISVSVLACVLWVVFAVLAFFGQYYAPLAPIACTVWLAVMVRRWKTMPH